MSSRKKQKQKLRAKQTQQQQQRPGQRIDEAQSALMAGKTEQAIELGTKALNANLDPGLRTRGANLLTEAHFRAAAESPLLEKRLSHLESAIRLNPQQARLHYHAGATLLRMKRATPAIQSFDRALALDSSRPGLRFLRELANVMNGQPQQTDGFDEAEVSSLQLAQALLKSDEYGELTSQFATKPLVGQADGLWQVLLQMADNPKSAPIASFAAQREAARRLAASPVVAYYTGVAALRRGDKQAALPIWRQLAQEGALSTDWFKENATLLMRDRASALAEAQQWQEIVSLPISESEVASDGVLSEVVAAAHFHLGYAAAETGSWDQAMHHWEHSNRLAKDRRSAQNLALAQERLERWNEAAVSWREMVRRRPRKSDHPDALTDDQVAALWRHAADCYAQVANAEEEIACLRNALKYRENDLELRLRLADALEGEDRSEAARGELERLLEIAPDHVPALMRLGALYQSLEVDDALPIWRRVVALEPTNQDARNTLAICYAERARGEQSSGWLSGLFNRTAKQQRKILEEGLKELPDHPILLIELGRVQYNMGDNPSAQQSLRKAWEVAPTNINTAGAAMHELLHAKGDHIVEELLPSIRTISGLLAAFWLSQAEQVHTCELDERWIDRFFDEAIVQAGQRVGTDSPTFIFMLICDMIFGEHLSGVIKTKWEARARAEAGHAGLNEYIQARGAIETGNTRKAVELLRKGRRLAQNAKEDSAAEHFQQVETLIQQPASFLSRLLGGLENDDELMDIFRQFERAERKRR